MARLEKNGNVIQIIGNLRVDNIDETMKNLKSLDLPNGLTLDFSRVDMADTTAISFVLEIQRTLDTAYSGVMKVNLVGVSESLRSLMQLYDVDRFLLI